MKPHEAAQRAPSGAWEVIPRDIRAADVIAAERAGLIEWQCSHVNGSTVIVWRKKP